MPEEKREEGFYWVKLKPYESVLTQEPSSHEWSPAHFTGERWYAIGNHHSFRDGDIEEVGPKCELIDSKVRSAARSLMIDIESMQDPDTEKDTHTYGPFSEWSMADDGGVMIDWYNLGYDVEEYHKIVRP